MQGKDSKISYVDNLNTFQIAVDRISQIQEILQTIATDVDNLVKTDSFTGAAADNIKAYAQEVHLPLISSVSMMLSEYQAKLLLYYTGYYEIDDDYASKFCSETMSNYQEQVRTFDNNNYSVSESITTALNKVSDIISLSTPSMGDLSVNLNWMANKIDTLDQSLVDYEETHSTDMDSLVDFIANLETFISYYRENVKPGDYHAGDVSSNIYAYTLYQSMMASEEFLNGNEAKIQDASEKLQSIAERMQADYDAACQARIDQGRAELIMGIGTALIGGIAIIATAGAATPIVAAVAVTGSCTIAYGLSNAVEGAEDIYYGMQGDLSSYAYNPIRDHDIRNKMDDQR